MTLRVTQITINFDEKGEQTISWVLSGFDPRWPPVEVRIPDLEPAAGPLRVGARVFRNHVQDALSVVPLSTPAQTMLRG